MTKRNLWIFLIILILPCTVLAQALLHPLNLDFETCKAGFEPTGWKLTQNSLVEGYYVKCSDDALAGKSSAEFGRYEDEKPTKSFGLVYQDFITKYNRGKAFTMTFAIKPIKMGAKAKYNLWCECANDRNVRLDSYSKDVLIENKNGWQIRQIKGIIHQYSDYMRMGVMLTGEGSLLIDECTFTIETDSRSTEFQTNNIDNQTIDRLIAFSRVYGWARYFQPSTESAGFDWDILPLCGLELAENKQEDEDYIKSLDSIFSQITPGIEFFKSVKQNKKKNNDTIEYIHADNHSVSPNCPDYSIPRVAIANIHTGCNPKSSEASESTKIMNVFHSRRDCDGIIFQYVPIDSVKNKRITFSAKAKLNPKDSSAVARLWLYYEAPSVMSNKSSFFSRDFYGNDWDSLTVSADIPSDCVSCKIACALGGDGKVFYDDLSLSYQNANGIICNINVDNSNFEFSAPGSLPKRWRPEDHSVKAGYNFTTNNTEFTNGLQSMLIESDDHSWIKMPDSYSSFETEIMPGFYAKVPLTLCIDTMWTLPHYEKLVDSIKTFKNINYSLFDCNSRIGIVILLWNLLEHFNVNFDTATSEVILRTALEKAANDSTTECFEFTLQNMLPLNNDPAARIWNSVNKKNKTALVFVESIGEKLYISHKSPDNNELHPGDEITKINGIPTKQFLKNHLNGFSLQHTNVNPKRAIMQAVADMRAGVEGSTLNLELLSDSGVAKIVQLPRKYSFSEIKHQRPENYIEILKRISYIDLTRTTDFELRDRLKWVDTTSSGIIVDLRGTTNVTFHFLGLFADESRKSIDWSVPIFTAPDKSLVSQKVLSSVIIPKMKFPQTRIVFLSDWRSTGYSEAFLALAKFYKLGKIIGSATAGAAGEVYGLSFPGEFNVALTGMVPYLPDGSPLFGKPIQPDEEVETTLADIKSGNDPYIQKALEYLQNK